ncbi:hypothetical protein PENSOL_c070G00428 [Penicillium solitum]|uniref:Uncharacterized protein n=1 Tax=Penicillium solitum TaxID=60172 RepID=A0A1V6QH52_9EURO|nr:uncharacterized protein PENSOL_c070G00428 [Penicillium solitum]OQD88551.1 hypothetical protein PENSOL_c070G00428 [Penicillium solitum]
MGLVDLERELSNGKGVFGIASEDGRLIDRLIE